MASTSSGDYADIKPLYLDSPYCLYFILARILHEGIPGMGYKACVMGVFGAPAPTRKGINTMVTDVSDWLPWTAQTCGRPLGCAQVSEDLPIVCRRLGS